MNRRQNVCCSSKQVTLNGMQCNDARYILNMFSKYSRYLTYRYLTERYKEQVYVHYYVQLMRPRTGRIKAISIIQPYVYHILIFINKNKYVTAMFYTVLFYGAFCSSFANITHAGHSIAFNMFLQFVTLTFDPKSYHL